MSNFRLMAASKYDAKKQKFPCLGSPKYDGIRCYARAGAAYARSLKKIPNLHVQKLFSEYAEVLEGFDGELIVGLPHSSGEMVTFINDRGEKDERLDDPFDRTSGAIRRADGEPDFKFYVFDIIASGSYKSRLLHLEKLEAEGKLPDWVVVVQHEILEDEVAVKDHHDRMVEAGYEGSMLRIESAPYKYGRSTANECYLAKVKIMEMQEAVIIGYEEEMENLNSAVRNEQGLLERSSHKDNKRGKGTLGSLTCRMLTGRFEGVEFSIGTGLSAKDREDMWRNREGIVGKIISVSYFDIGSKYKPRFPVFNRFRDAWDMDGEIDKKTETLLKSRAKDIRKALKEFGGSE